MGHFRTCVGIEIPTILLILATLCSGAHICNTNDLTSFCLVTRHFRQIVESVNPPIYPQFTELIALFPNVPYQTYSQIRGDTTLSATTMFSYQDMCELENVVSGFSAGATRGAKNPFRLEVTEIWVNGSRLHNWLHLKISSTNAAAAGATGRIKMGFLIVHDKNSYPVGDFNHQLPCGADCNCKYFRTPTPSVKQCLQANHTHHVPCMFTNNQVVTHPGQMMFYDVNGVEEIHASWHFGQHQDPQVFVSELHFKALLFENIESNATVITMTRLNLPSDESAFISSPPIRTGRFGWNPVYTILHPTVQTVGGWGHFRKNVYAPSEIECHKPLTEGFYVPEVYPTMGPAPIVIPPAFKAGITGARHNDYSARDTGAQEQAVGAPQAGTEARLYHGRTTQGVGFYQDPSNNQRAKGLNDIELNKLTSLVPISPALLEADRCICPMIPTHRPPSQVPPPETQIQGRKAHALQMIIAWLMLVPFGIFVSRYFKETYSKVFFLQEYWWYSIHVLCMAAALMFMYGGIYAMEIKRSEPIQWGDDAIMVHGILGTVAMLMFTIHFPLGFFRLRVLQGRLVQIFLHWFFGNLEYGLAIACILSSGYIVSGCLPCSAVAFLALWLLVQLFIFMGMELHMRDVDKRMELKPKRSYLPPPVMRVFHDNAPDSKFRVQILAVYALLCILTFIAIHSVIKSDQDGGSCFHELTQEDV